MKSDEVLLTEEPILLEAMINKVKSGSSGYVVAYVGLISQLFSG